MSFLLSSFLAWSALKAITSENEDDLFLGSVLFGGFVCRYFLIWIENINTGLPTFFLSAVLIQVSRVGSKVSPPVQTEWTAFLPERRQYWRFYQYMNIPCLYVMGVGGISRRLKKRLQNAVTASGSCSRISNGVDWFVVLAFQIWWDGKDLLRELLSF